MTRSILSILIIILLTTCSKKVEQKNCTTDDCYGTHTSTLANIDKTYIPTKDTIYKYVNINNDTIKLNFRTTAIENQNSKYTCACEDKSTNITRECIYSIFTFENKDLALKYSIMNTYPANYAESQISSSNITLVVQFSDTNTIIHNIYKSTDPCSIFTSSKYNLKQNDLDSLSINNKYFYNIINTFDNIGLCPTAEIKDVYFSKIFGLIRFKYNNLVYDVIH